LRPDRKKVELSEFDVANKMKKMLEERQRSDKKKRTSDGEDWAPQWFHKIPDEDGGHTWVYCGNYWEQRKEKIEKILEGDDMSECELLNGGNAKNTASDFKSYDFDN